MVRDADPFVNWGGRHVVFVALLLFLCTALLYWRATFNDFIESYDDSGYITQNVRVQQGLTAENIYDAFTTVFYANWHPLTILSHMADCQIFGLQPWGHHLGNVLLHAMNAAILFLVLRRLTDNPICSLAVAILFAVHPLHVQSVALISQRKDVLSTLFWILGMWAYGRYAARPRVSAYVLVVVFFVLGLLSKPMVVTFPFTLLLLDIWPLKRLTWPVAGDTRWRKAALWLVAEKVPLLLLSMGASFVTFLAQSSSGATIAGSTLPLSLRMANAVVSYSVYVWKTFWPLNLAAHYPYPASIPFWQIAISASILIAITGFALATLGKRPYVGVGWFWFLGTLVPVIGIVQVGIQSMADRYTYVPHIGLFIAIVWLAADVIKRIGLQKHAVVITAVVVTAVLSVLTWVEIGYWKDAETLWRRTLATTDDNVRARHILAIYYADQGRVDEALALRREALDIERNSITLVAVGATLGQMGQLPEAEAYLKEALTLEGDSSEALYYLGGVYVSAGRFQDAEDQYALVENKNAVFHVMVGRAFLNAQAYDFAERHLQAALQLDPQNGDAFLNLGILYERTQQASRAVEAYRQAMREMPALRIQLERRILQIQTQQETAPVPR